MAPQPPDTLHSPQPAAKVGADSVKAARVMVDVFRLANQATDAVGILNGILDGVETLVGQDAVGVYIVDVEGRRFRRTLVRGCDLSIPDTETPFDGSGVVGRVLSTGQPIAVTTDESPEAAAGRSCARSRLVVPIIGSTDRVLGALDVWSDRPGGYDELSARLLEVYGLAVAGTIESARLQAEVIHKRRLDSELAVARQVMQGLFPHTTPDLPGFEIAGAHQPSFDVGGDYYEFIPLPDDRWGVVIADVVGKGIAAALLVSALRASIASLAGHELAVRAIMRRANRFFYESVDEGKFVTLFYGVIDVQRRQMLYVNAGHFPPIILRANGGVEQLEEGGVPLGLFEAPRYFEGHADLHDGDLLALFTDGIVEAMDATEAQYGRERLLDQLRQRRHQRASEICAAIMHDVHRYGTFERQDDRTLLILRTLGTPDSNAVER